ncbi:MAG: hypothetical protein HY078_07290 [Elusimicrobia bacterium]|nr:hypothetical protein [Elusimicrobiota bacterium]
MRKALVLSCLAIAITPAFAQVQTELMHAAGVERMPAVAAVAGRPVRATIQEGTIGCTMDVNYRERSFNPLVIISVWKELRGSATVTCAGHAPVKLTIYGRGPSIGVGLPNNGFFHNTGRGVAGSVQIRVPAPFMPKRLAGDYINVGPSTFIGGVSFSPWVNTDASFNATIWLPTTFKAALAIDLQKLSVRLQRK